MGGSSKGKGSGGDASDYSEAMSRIAADLYQSTDPMRKSMVGRYEDFLQGDFDPTASPMFDPGKRAIETQYGTAQENIISNLPQGGVLLDSLARADMSKAGSLSNMIGRITQGEYDKAYGMANLSPQTSLSGYGSAAQTMGNLAGQQQAGKMGALGDIGLGGGMIIGTRKKSSTK